jgi:hypothetical protein
MGRFRYSLLSTTQVFRDHPLRLAVAVVLLDAAGAIAAYLLAPAGVAKGATIAGAVVVGTALVIVVVFTWAFFTAPRRHLAFRVSEVERTLEGLSGRVDSLFEKEFGPPLRFLPVYHVLRTDLREAIRIVGRAIDTGRLWSRTDPPEDANWKRERREIGTNPWALIDGLHGELQEAFDHITRLNTSTAIRFWGTRVVRDSDDLDSALAAFHTAEGLLTRAIERLEALSAIEKPTPLWEGDEA